MNLLFLREDYSCLHDCWSPAKVSQFLALTTVRKIESSPPRGLAFLLQPEWAPFHVLLGINFISFNLFSKASLKCGHRQQFQNWRQVLGCKHLGLHGLHGLHGLAFLRDPEGPTLPTQCPQLYPQQLFTHSQQWWENIKWKFPERRRNHSHLTVTEVHFYIILLHY